MSRSLVLSRACVVLALVGSGFLACVEHPTSEPTIGSETHWMLPCVVPETCGEVSECICNVCAPSCESDADCLAPGRCALPGSPELASMCGSLLPARGGLCLLPCEANAQCADISVHWPQPDEFALVCAEDRCLPYSKGRDRKVDILWVVDNSGSMCEEQQALRTEFGAFAEEMGKTNVDFQLAVITTDMEDPLESGRFQNLPDGDRGASCDIPIDISSCPSVTGEGAPPLILSSEDRRYRDAQGTLDVELLQRDFGCSATTGTKGTGFEMGLEAARVALSEPMVSGQNAGFLREDANLAVVFVTDENDCSDGGVLDKVNGNICEWESGRLIPVAEYIDFFANLKRDMFGNPDRNRVVMASISAPDSGIRFTFGEDVTPSCTTATGRGFSGYRYDEVVRAFPNRAQGNVCTPPFSEALKDIAVAIGRSFE